MADGCETHPPPRAPGCLGSSCSAPHPSLSLRQSGFELLGARAVDLRDRFLDGVGKCRVHRVGAVPVVDSDHASRARWQCVVHLLRDPALEPVLGELARHAAERRSDRGRGQQRRCEEADDEPNASADLEALATQVVACLIDLHLAFGVLLDEDNALDRDHLVLGELQHRLEVLLREIVEEVGSDHHILLLVAHVAPSYALIACPASACSRCSCNSCSCSSVRCGLTSKTTFLTVPVNTNGDLSA